MEISGIIQEIRSRGLTGYKIAEDTGLTQVGIDKILNGTTKNPNKKTIEILHNYLYNNYAKQKEDSKTTLNKSGVPYYDVDFTASFVAVENYTQKEPSSYISHPFFEGCDYVVRASGQSMAKVICHGDAIGLIKINNWMDFFPFGEIYAIVTNDNFRMIKVITKGETNDTFTLISKPTDSKKDEFPPQQIKKSSILSIFKVQASSHLF
ncbi:MAG: hypothetical protein K2P85_07790 [Flavobacteriaceae bacterium]|nr:hypothetical protein [Flavobacteriaceae bacterium]